MSSNAANRPFQLDCPSRSKPINDTWLYRCLTIASIQIARPFQNHSGPILLLSPRICVKYGDHRDLAEARTMQFIAQHTSIPVPKVYCSFRRKGKTYIVMERIDGHMATTVWSSLSPDSRERILLQLKDMIHEMRAIPSRDDRIASVDGGSLWDCRLPSNLQRFGPFENTRDFHAFLRNQIDKAPPGYPEIDEMIALQNLGWGNPIFTHGDLSSLNILLREENVVGIVDWETAGWYPPYWEYTSARQVNPRNYFWEDYIDMFLDPWPTALKMEKVRQTWWAAV